MSEKRVELIALSKMVKPKLGQDTFAGCETVNDGLCRHHACTVLASIPDSEDSPFHNTKDVEESFHSFKGWKEQGFHVRKGETGFPIWGKPRKFKKETEGGKEKEFSAFPIAYLFHKGQVEKMDGKPRPKSRKKSETTLKTDAPTVNDKLANRLDELAQSMEKQIQEKLSPAIAGQNPTPRRLRIAAGMRGEGRTMQLAQAVLRAAAENARKAEPTGWPKMLPPSMWWLSGVTSKKAAMDYVSKYSKNIRQAMADFGVAPKEDKGAKVQEKINELCGTKIDGFFPTPDAIADQMAELAEFPPGLCTFLEPSAGYGALIDAAIRKHGDGRLEITAHEVNTRLWEILRLKYGKDDSNFTLSTERDFIESFGPKRFERIMMNPPFEKGQDMMHVQAAYAKLAPNGILVAIVCENCFYRTDGEYPEFREWLDDLGAEVTDLPAGAFTGTIRTTNVKTRIVKIRK